MLTAENQITWRKTCPSVVSHCFPQISYRRAKSSLSVTGRLLSVGAKARPHTCLVLKTVSNDTELSPAQVAYSHLASAEVPQLSFKMNVHYRIHNSWQLGPILRQPNPAYIFLKTITELVLQTIVQQHRISCNMENSFEIFYVVSI